ncbi:MAG: hypothetical protein ABW034_02555 [Steroidobacteraceae bacterium]
MAIQARTLVGAAGVLVVAAIVIGFITLMPKPQATVQAQDASQREWSVEVSDVEE